MQLHVESVKPLQKSMAFMAGGVEYMAKKDSGISVGMTIETEPELSEYNGKTYRWVKKYRAVNNAPAPTPPTNGSGTAWLPFASNTVAHAITGGLIQTPDQVKLWAAAAKQAYEELTK